MTIMSIYNFFTVNFIENKYFFKGVLRDKIVSDNNILQMTSKLVMWIKHETC